MNTRLDARIEAGAAELQHQMMLFRSPNVPGGGTELFPSEYVEIATVVLAAADSVERPGVERLVAALEHASMVMRAARISTASKAPNTSELLLEEAEGIDDLVAEFGGATNGRRTRMKMTSESTEEN